MTITRPKRVKVGPHTYKILYSKDSWRKHKMHKTNAVGLCLIGQTTILVQGWKLSESQLRDTLLHEIMHACLGLVMFDAQPFELPPDKHDVEEIFILIVAPILLQVIQDNPEVFEWLAHDTD